ncbi:hypothetical protein [Streptomyces cacaoi]|uniref:hypothetical protein n=1 Tax=Streptomyces cacaoi TaxID=1898 RepID=UPI00374A1546
MALYRRVKIPPSDAGLTRYRLGPSRLFLEDVQAIYDALCEAAKQRAEESEDGEASSVTIVADETPADSPQDLLEATPEELRNLRMASKKPLVSVDLWSHYADVSAQSSDVEGEAVARGIRDYVNRRRHWRGGYRFFDNVMQLLLFLLGIVTAVAVVSVDVRQWPIALASFAICAAAAFANVMVAYRTGTVRIVPQKRNEARWLSGQGRRDLFVSLTGAIVGAAILGIAGLWAGIRVH